MPSPYRETDNAPPAPLAELGRRRRKLGAVRWAELLLVGEIVLVFTTGLPRFALPGVVAWFVLGAGLAAATWMLTAPPRGGRVGWAGWLLRGSVPAWLVAVGLLQLRVQLQLVGLIAGGLIFVGAVASALRRPPRTNFGLEPWLPALALLVLMLVMLLTGAPHFQVPAAARWRYSSLVFLLFVAAMPAAVRRALLPSKQRWWFDNESEAPGAWVALLLDPDGPAEVLRAGALPERFDSRRDARAWLKENGYVPAKRALAERLVDSVPPDVLPRAKSREAQRARQRKPRKTRTRRDEQRVGDSEPRVRVAAEPEAVADEPALDNADPPRAGAVHTPHE